MKKHFLKFFCTIALVAASLPSYATLALRLSADGGATWMTVVDNDVNDLDATPGSIIFSGSLAEWTFSVDVGISMPAQGSAIEPYLELFSQDVSTSEGTLLVELTETGFTSAASSRVFTNLLGGTTDGITSFKTFMDAGNVPFGEGAELTADGPFAQSSFSDTILAASMENGGGPFSLTIQGTISHGGGQSFVSSFDNILQGPAIVCSCAPHDIKYNFNGTQIIFQPTTGGSYVWFISDGKVNGLPAHANATLHISDQVIVIPATSSSPQYTIPVPDAFITFSPTATTATTTFDTANGVWRMTFPSSGMAGNVFYGGAAFKVPVAGLPGGIKNVDWTGTFTSDTAGLSVNWQWSAAAYNNFTSDYNAVAPKPTDDNKASVYKNSDHAGTPEGTDSGSGKPWKAFVEGGASGGGGGNYTGSGSSTISVKPCVCPASNGGA